MDKHATLWVMWWWWWRWGLINGTFYILGISINNSMKRLIVVDIVKKVLVFYVTKRFRSIFENITDIHPELNIFSTQFQALFLNIK
jgi:hypothetical protein